MRVTVEMTTEEQKFSVASWWAKTPDFALAALAAQLAAATAMWPELEEWKLRARIDDPPSEPCSQAVTASDFDSDIPGSNPGAAAL